MTTNNDDKEIMNALKMKESGVMTDQILHAHTNHKNEIMEIFSVIDKLQNESSQLTPSQESLHQTLHAMHVRNKRSWHKGRIFVPLAFAVLVVGFFISKPGSVQFESSTSSKIANAPETLQETVVAMENEDPNFFEPASFNESNDIQLVSSDFEDNNFATLYDTSL